MAYYPELGAVVLFGGIVGDNYPEVHNETWHWDCLTETWSKRFPSVSPPPRRSHAMAYDSVRHRVVLFGGGTSDGRVLDDTWVYNGDTWTQICPGENEHPTARSSHAMAYDTKRRVVVLFGGVVNGVNEDDTWELDPNNCWTDVSPPEPNRPAPRQYPAMAYDSDYDLVLMFGGQSPHYNDLWAWDGASWAEILPHDPNAQDRPSPRYAAGMAYDSVRRRTVLFGGAGPAGHLDDTWEWKWDWGSCWTNSWEQILTTVQPSPRLHVGMAFDDGCLKTVLFGGWFSVTEHLNDTWVYPDVENVDCNRNGIPDECDITNMTSFDCNANGIPDECECADLNGDCVVNRIDLAILLAYYGQSGPHIDPQDGDLDFDCDVDLSDLGILLPQYGKNCP